MECENSSVGLNTVKVEIKEEIVWEEEDETAAEPNDPLEFTSVLLPSLGIKKESFAEVNDVDEDLLSISPRLTSEHVSQDGSGSCSSFILSDSGAHCQEGEVVADSKVSKVFADTPPFKCAFCEKSFKWKSRLEVHYLVHTDTRLHKCAICEKSFKQKGHLGWHMQFHSDEKPHKCGICEKSFKQKGHLDRHIQLHSDLKPHKCDICEKSFKQKYNLERHIELHSDARPFKCDKCENAFKRKSHLDQHILVHSDTKPNKCDMCEKSFNRKSHLQRHMLSHSDTTPQIMTGANDPVVQCP